MLWNSTPNQLSQNTTHCISSSRNQNLFSLTFPVSFSQSFKVHIKMTVIFISKWWHAMLDLNLKAARPLEPKIASENQLCKPKNDVALWKAKKYLAPTEMRVLESHCVFIHRYCKLKNVHVCIHACMHLYHSIPLHDIKLHSTTLHDIDLHCIIYIHPYGYYSIYHVIMLRIYIYIAKQVFTCIKRYICVSTGPPQTHPARFSTGTQKGPFSKHCSSW